MTKLQESIDNGSSADNFCEYATNVDWKSYDVMEIVWRKYGVSMEKAGEKVWRKYGGSMERVCCKGDRAF